MLSQVALVDGSLRWVVVDRSGPSRLSRSGEPAVARYDESSDEAALAAMECSAARRQEVAERLDPSGDRHILFVAVTHAELKDHGIGG